MRHAVLRGRHSTGAAWAVVLLAALAPGPGRAQSATAQGTAANVWVLDHEGRSVASYNVAPGDWTTQASPSGGQTQIQSESSGSTLIGLDPADFGAVLVNQTDMSLPALSPGVPRTSLVGLASALSIATSTGLPSVSISPAPGTYAETIEVVIQALPPSGNPNPDALEVLWSVDGSPQASANSPAEVRVFLVADGLHTVDAQAHAVVAGQDFFSAPASVQLTLANAGPITRDSDGDGVPDVFEAARGMNPLAADLDSDRDDDGWTDFEEVVRGSDPDDLNSVPLDSDGDQWPDYDESIRGTNPNDPAHLTNLNDPERFFPSRPVARRRSEVEYTWSGAVFEDNALTLKASPLGMLSVLSPEWTSFFDQSELPSVEELSDLGLLESELPPWLRPSLIAAPLATGDLPALRTPGGDGNLIQIARIDGNGDPDGWVVKAWVDGTPDLHPREVIEFLASQSQTFTTALEWENAYTAYLTANAVQPRSIDVAPATSASLALVEGIVAWYAQLPPDSLLLMGDPRSAPAPSEALDALINTLAITDAGRTLDDLHTELAAQFGTGGAFETWGNTVAALFATFDPLTAVPGKFTTKLVAALLQGDPGDDDPVTRYRSRLYATMSQAELDGLDPATRAALLDPAQDSDGDSLANGSELSAPPPGAASPDSANADGDLYADAYDPCPGDAENHCLMLGPQTADGDGDGIIDSLDNCLNDANLDQADAIGTGVGDGCRRLANIEKPVYHPTLMVGVALEFTSIAADPTAVPPLTYAWDFGDGQGSPLPQPGFIAYSSAGVYPVTLTVTDAALAMTIDTRTVTVIGSGPGVDAAGPYGGVEGDALLLSATGSSLNGGIVSFDWDFGDLSTGSGNPIAHTYLQDGAYTAQVTATDGVGLTASDSASVLIQDSLPVASFQAIPAHGTAPLDVQFVDTSTAFDGIASRQWDFDDGSPPSSDTNPTHQFTAPGSYNVTLTVTDGDGSIDSVSMPVDVSVVQIPIPVLPTAARGALLLLLLGSSLFLLIRRRGQA